MFSLGANMTCFAAKHLKFGIHGCCQLNLFSYNKIFFARIFRHLTIISGDKCAVTEHEISQKVEKKYEQNVLIKTYKQINVNWCDSCLL